MSNTESLPTGLYRIVVAEPGGHADDDRLSRQGNNRVTILPPDAVPAADQVWRIREGQGGLNIVIELLTNIFPRTYLTYNDAPQKPKQGGPILTRTSEFPPNEWHVAMEPGSTESYLRVAGSNLGISYSPIVVHPPILVLSADNPIKWDFVKVG